MLDLETLRAYSKTNLSTDEIALALNSKNELIKELEKMDFKTGSDEYILLKWGTLKGWKLNSIKGQKLLQEYQAIGTSSSVMLQKDSERQRELIIEMIDVCDGVIKSDWTGEYFTKDEAEKYINEYKN